LLGAAFIALALSVLRAHAEPALPADAAVGKPSAISLSEVIRLVEENNPHLLASKYLYALSELDIKRAGRFPNPQLNLYGGYGKTTTLLGNPQFVGLTQLVETGGKRKARGLQARAQHQLTDAEYESKRWDLRMMARQAYVDLVIAQRQYDLLSVTTRQLDEIIQAAEQRFEAGAAPEAELIQAHHFRRLLEPQRITALSDIENAQTRLNNLTGYKLPLLFQADESELLPPLPGTPGNSHLANIPLLDSLLETAYQARQDSLIAARKADVAQSEIRLSKARRVPDLEVMTGYMFVRTVSPITESTRKDFFDGGFTQINVELPIFHSGREEVQKARIALQQAQQELEAVRNDIRAEVSQAYASWKADRDNMLLYRESILPAEEEAWRIIQKEYREGKTDLFSAVSAQQNLQQAHQSYLNAIAQYYHSISMLERAIGAPISGTD
jgi:cobalt-zinc-cadmium efflux system outer membrane protein